MHGRIPRCWGSRWIDALRWANNSDGHDRSLQIYRPFYALDVRHAGGLTVADTLGTDTRYQLGNEYDHYQHALRLFDVYAGWSPGLRSGHTVRLTGGWHSEHDTFSPMYYRRSTGQQRARADPRQPRPGLPVSATGLADRPL